jgi:hypothetical protein
MLEIRRWEIRSWKWEYTDDTGQRRVSRWLMTEHEAMRYKDPVRLHHTLKVQYDPVRPPDKGGSELRERGVSV